jgi:crotonobetainyl-CoA:carnitine CoA-transferase CaiB-like acyl-CoA transferase
MTNLNHGALSGIRVLDFTRVLAGPFCTMMLGDQGAEVIKVEHPTGGDETRQWGPPWSGDLSAYFISVNRNKRSLTLNLKSETGQNLARQLAARSHIVIENFKVGQMADFGLGYEDLRAINPALVYCSITGFGQTGLYHNRPGYDYVIQAMSGLMSITGPANGEPHKVGVAVSDVFTGLFAHSSILAALRHAERTGEGQYIDVALLDSQITALVNIASNYLVSGETPPRLGNEHPNIVPYQTFHAADMEFVLAVGNDRQFAALCNLIGQPHLATDARYATNPKRLENRAELVEKLQTIFMERPAAAWVEDLLAVGIPAGPINDVAQSLNDPHVIERQLIQTISRETDEPLRMISPTPKLSATPGEIRLPPPRLGEHTDVILRELLNLSDKTLAAYRQAGVI